MANSSQPHETMPEMATQEYKKAIEEYKKAEENLDQKISKFRRAVSKYIARAIGEMASISYVSKENIEFELWVLGVFDSTFRNKVIKLMKGIGFDCAYCGYANNMYRFRYVDDR